MTTQEKKQLFNVLRETRNFREYLSEVEAKICDIRFGEYDTETRQAALKILKELLIDKIDLVNKPTEMYSVGD